MTHPHHVTMKRWWDHHELLSNVVRKLTQLYTEGRLPQSNEALFSLVQELECIQDPRYAGLVQQSSLTEGLRGPILGMKPLKD